MKYEDIMYLPHHVSRRRPRMSLYERSAQFAPFDALEGYSDEIQEVSRLTSKRIELSKESIDILNDKLNIIENNIKNKPLILVTYFIKDNKKDGGYYKTIKEQIKKIDKINKEIVLINNIKIKIGDIIDIDCSF